MLGNVLRIGTDEAGYGPLLGPLVIAGAVVRDGVGRARFRDPAVADSKVVYTRGGRDALAAALAPYLRHTDVPLRLGDLLARCSVRGDPRGGYAWYDEVLDPVPVPRPAPRPFRGLFVNPVCEREFNDGCRSFDSKGTLLFTETMRVVRAALDAHPGEPAEVTCDKHGGRNRYAALLMAELGAAEVAVVREGRAESVYRVVTGGRPVRVAFRARADAGEPLCALASMAAKYVRELFMESFNRWFAARVEGLRPTAGYYGDGRRWLADLERRWPDLERHRADLLRVR